MASMFTPSDVELPDEAHACRIRTRQSTITFGHFLTGKERRE